MANQDDDLEVFVDDMRSMSDFTYRFANIRNIVRKNNNTTIKTGGFLGFGGEKKDIKFVRPELIITAGGSQENDANQQLKYDITPNAIITFLESNRKYFDEAEPGAYLTFDETVTESEPFCIEGELKELAKDNFKIVDYDDRFSTEDGGLVYAVIINLTKKWVAVVFRGTIGLTDALADRDFRLDETSFFENEDLIKVPGGKPGTHTGFSKYLFSARKTDSVERPYIDRILACVKNEFENNPDVKGKGFKLYASGHSLGAGLANLFAFRVAQMKAKGDESVASFPPRVKAMSFAAPCVGNEDFNKEYQFYEKAGILRHIRFANKGDVVPTNDIPPPFSFALKGDSKLYTQNGVNLLLQEEEKIVTDYRNTKSMMSQFSPKSLGFHGLDEYEKRMDLEVNKEVFQQTVEELYQTAGDFTN